MALSKKWDEAWNTMRLWLGKFAVWRLSVHVPFKRECNEKKIWQLRGRSPIGQKKLITKIRCDFENDKTLVANWNMCYVDLVIQDDYLNPDYTHLQRSHGCQSTLNNVAVPNHEQRTVCICKISECCSGIAGEQITTYLSGIADRG